MKRERGGLGGVGDGWVNYKREKARENFKSGETSGGGMEQGQV